MGAVEPQKAFAHISYARLTNLFQLMQLYLAHRQDSGICDLVGNKVIHVFLRRENCFLKFICGIEPKDFSIPPEVIDIFSKILPLHTWNTDFTLFSFLFNLLYLKTF